VKTRNLVTETKRQL